MELIKEFQTHYTELPGKVNQAEEIDTFSESSDDSDDSESLKENSLKIESLAELDNED